MNKMKKWTVYFKLYISDSSASAETIYADNKEGALNSFNAIMKKRGYSSEQIFFIKTEED